MTATVISGNSPTGQVTFKDGTTTLGTVNVAGGVATLSYTFTSAGTHSLTAAYTGDLNNDVSSAAYQQSVIAANTTTALTSNLNPAMTTQAVTQAVTLTAIVTGQSPTGTVTFYDGTAALGTSPLAGGVATLSYAFATAGAHSLTATYGGNTNNTSSTSAAVAQNVVTATATALTATPSPATAGQAITLTATVTGQTPTGTVTFYDGTTALGTGTVTAGVATLSYTFTSVGTHSLTAGYRGDTNNQASTSAAVSLTVNPGATVTTLAAYPNPTIIGQPVNLSANVTGGNPSGTVTFYDGTTALGTTTLTGGQASLSYTFTTASVHSLTAVYGGDATNQGSTSQPLTETVNATAVMHAYNVYSDHLDTPREITDTAGNLVWQWDNTDPYGNNVPNENPANQGQFSFNLRFPGQYADVETNTYYNINRDYDPVTGRYVQSDPIGLLGGSPSPYTYVDENPMSWTDRLGLAPDDDDIGLIALMIAVIRGEIAAEAEVAAATEARVAAAAEAEAAAATKSAAAEAEAAAATKSAVGKGRTGANAAQRGAICPNPSQSPIWKELKPYNKSVKTNGQNGKGRQYYEWDYTHGDIEVYDRRGNHLGSIRPDTGKMYKPPVNGRKLRL